MTTWQLGQTVSWPLEIRDENGALADLGGGNPTATVTLPSAATAAASVTKTATGIYRADLVSTLAGRHVVTWTGSGTNSGALPWSDVADVWPADPRMIVSPADARAALNTLAASRVNDDELRGYLVAATLVIEHLAGPKLQATRVEYHTGAGRPAIGLHRPPAAITSVVEAGTTLAASDYSLDNGGVLWRGSGRFGGAWSSVSTRNVVVTYTTGEAIVPQNVVLAAAHLVAHWWRQTQQSPRPAFGEDIGAGGIVVAGYAVPHIVTDLLSASDTRLPGIG